MMRTQNKRDEQYLQDALKSGRSVRLTGGEIVRESKELTQALAEQEQQRQAQIREMSDSWNQHQVLTGFTALEPTQDAAREREAAREVTREADDAPKPEATKQPSKK